MAAVVGEVPFDGERFKHVAAACLGGAPESAAHQVEHLHGDGDFGVGTVVTDIKVGIF